ncbi:MAG: HEAT repeat domain-containing protein [Dehalococcoidia bacterium]
MRTDIVRNLCTLLDRDNDLTRCWSAKALGLIGSKIAVPSLIERLRQDPDPDVRMEAAAALGKLASVEATEALIDSLRQDPDGDVRIQACIALGDIGHTRALDTLITSLTDEESVDVDDWGAGDDMEFEAAWEIQQRALEILGEWGDARAVDTIIRLLEADAYEDLQELGFRVLARLAGDKARGFLLRQLQGGNRVVRRRVAKALTYMPDSEVVPVLIQALRDRDPDVRINAAQALAESRDPSVVAPLLALLKDLHGEVRREAAVVVATKLPGDEVLESLLRLLGDRKRAVQQQVVQVLGERREAQATGPLLTLLESNQSDEAFCTELIKALGKIRAPEAIEPLCKLLKESQVSPETRLQIVLTLGDAVTESKLAGPERRESDKNTAGQLDPVGTLITAVGDEDEKVCLGALLSLARIGGARVSETLVKAIRGEMPAAHEFSDRQRMVRCYAARISRETNDQAIVDALLHAAEDGEPELQREALISLGSLRHPGALRVALQSLFAAAREVQLAAIEVLGVLPSTEAVAPLITMIRAETDPFVVQRAIEVLGSLGDRQATACIAQRLQDEDREVRRAALHALEVLGDSGVIETVRPLIFAQSGELRREAVVTLKKLGDTEIPDLLLATLQNMEEEEHHWIAIEALAELCRTA